MVSGEAWEQRLPQRRYRPTPPPQQPTGKQRSASFLCPSFHACRAVIAVLTWHQVRRWRRSPGGEAGGAAADAAAAEACAEGKPNKAAGPPSFAISARASSEGSSGGSSGGDTPRPQAGRPAAAEGDAAAIDRAAHAIVDAAEEEAQRKWVQRG